MVRLIGFPLGGRLLYRLWEHELEISAVLVGAFAFAVLAEALGMHVIAGVYMAGPYFGQRAIEARSYLRVQRSLSAIIFGFLAQSSLPRLVSNFRFRRSSRRLSS